jgi:LPXTG-motif cell wall-anchored protein
MKRKIALLALGIASLAAGFYLGTPAAMATGKPIGPTWATCPNLVGWYANADEQADLPQPTAYGLKFEGKDLIHHATSPIDFADMDHVTTTFTSTSAGKVVFKVETSAPYSTIITNADGKVWSTAMTYDQEGGQGHPVTHYSDLIGKPTKPGKPMFDSASRVVTFGVGYWVEEGSTVVKTISFHGTVYSLSCFPHSPSASPTPTKTASATPTATASASTSPSASPKPTTAPPTVKPTTATPSSPPSSSAASSAPPILTGNDTTGGALPTTGPSASPFIIGGLGAIAAGIVLFIVAMRRRKVSFES